MTTITKEETSLVSTTNRKIVEAFTYNNQYRIKITTSHYKNYKCYRTVVSFCEIEIGNGYTTEKYQDIMGGNSMRLVNQVPAPRYNYQQLVNAHLTGHNNAKAIIDLFEQQISNLLNDKENESEIN